MVNGDFEKIGADGKPEGWENVADVTVERENKNTFVRFKTKPKTDGSTTCWGEYIQSLDRITIPENAKSLSMSLRLRASCDTQETATSPARAQLAMFDAAGTTKWIVVKTSCRKNRWTELCGEYPVPVGCTNIKLLLLSGEYLGLFDFDDIEVTFK